MTAMHTMGLAPVLPDGADVIATATEYVVHLPVPGFARDELEVELIDHVLTVRGDQTEEAEDEGIFELHERLEESFRLPVDADVEHLTAAYGHGALELRAPRVEGGGVLPRKVPIDEHRLGVNPDASGV